MRSWSSHEVVRELEKAGWVEVAVVGSHHQYKHPNRPGRVTVKHPVKDIPRRTLDSIERQSGLTFR